MINGQQHNTGTAGYVNPRTCNSLFPNWEHVHPGHDRLIKKAEVSDIFKILTVEFVVFYLVFFTHWARSFLYFDVIHFSISFSYHYVHTVNRKITVLLCCLVVRSVLDHGMCENRTTGIIRQI